MVSRILKKFKTLNGRLPLKHGSDQAQTFPKRVSDDSRHFIFDAQKIVLGIFFSNIWRRFFFQESCVLEELGIFERHWQIPRRKSLPVVRLFSLYDPWRRGKRVGTCF